MSRLTFFFALYLVWAIVSSRIFFHQVWAASLLFLPLLVDAVFSQTSWSLAFFFSTVFMVDLAVCIALSPAQILWQNRKLRAKNQPAEEYFLGPESGEQSHRQYAFDIVAVHGLGSNPDTAWVYKDSVMNQQIGEEGKSLPPISDHASPTDGSSELPPELPVSWAHDSSDPEKYTGTGSVLSKLVKGIHSLLGLMCNLTHKRNNLNRKREALGPMWLRDLLPKSKLRARVLVFYHNSAWESHALKMDLEGWGDQLLQFAERHRSESKSPRSRPIIFIGYSFGGIIIKKALVMAKSREDSPFRKCETRFIFLGTPHRGSPMTSLARLWSLLGYWSGSSLSLLEVMESGSKENNDLHDLFLMDHGQNEIVSYYEVEPERWGELQITTTVSKESASINGQRRNYSFLTSHRSMQGFKDTTDPAFIHLLSQIEMLFKDAVRKGYQSMSTSELIELFRQEVGFVPEDDDIVMNENSLADQTLQLVKHESYWGIEWLTETPEYQGWKDRCEPPRLYFEISRDTPSKYVTRLIRQIDDQLSTCSTDAPIRCIEFSRQHSSASSLLLSLIFKLLEDNHAVEEIDKSLLLPQDFDTTQITHEEPIQRYCSLAECIIEHSRFDTILLFDQVDGLVLDKLLQPLLINTALTRKLRVLSVHSRRLLSRFFRLKGLQTWSSETGMLMIDVARERIQLLKTLRFVEWNIRETKVETHKVKGTWLSSSIAYVDWKESTRSGIFWIKGKPGSGKSTAAKFICNELRDNFQAKEKPGPIVASFYYSFRDGIKATAHRYMLQSITYQIWEQDRRLFFLLRNRFKKLSETPKLDMWTSNELKSALRSLHQVKFSLNVFIIIDGMDESDNDERTDILHFLRDLSSPDDSSQCNLKLLLASRPETDIRISFGDDLDDNRQITLQEVNYQDIKFVVDERVAALALRQGQGSSPSNKYNSRAFSTIKSYILEKAEGVFLWVDLVLKEFASAVSQEKGQFFTLEELDRKIRCLPRELGGQDGYYKMMVNRLTDQEKDIKKVELSRRLLAWVSFSERAIFVTELEDLIGIPNLSCKDLSQHDIRASRAQGLEKVIASYCGHFVEVLDIHHGQIVQLIHNTAREFLLSENQFAVPYHLDQIYGDTEIATSCSRYIQTILSAKGLQSQLDATFSEAGEAIECISDLYLFEYAIHNLQTHLEHLGNKGMDISSQFTTFIDVLRKGETSYASLLAHWIQPQDPETVKLPGDSCLRHLLVCAAGAGRLDVMKLLLTLRGQPYDFWHNDQLQRPPEVGISAWNTVQQLLGKEPDQTREYHSALEAAFDRGHKRVVSFIFHTCNSPKPPLSGPWGTAVWSALSRLPDKIKWKIIRS